MRAVDKYIFSRWLKLSLLALLAFEPAAYAQYEGTATPPPPASIPVQSQPAFSQQELDQMLAPIALYPDPLLSQILMAATYPLEIVESARWSRTNQNVNGDEAVRAIQQKPWDPSIKSLVAFPQILLLMDEKLDWTERLGDAFLAQQAEVMNTVQNLRQKAYFAGTFMSNDHIRVEPEGQIIVVEPANPGIVYVPYYDPNVVFGPWWWPDYPPIYWEPWSGYVTGSRFAPGISWDIGIAIATGFFFGDIDWHHRRVHVVNVNNYYYNRLGHDKKNATHQMNASPGIWQHDPDHRRGAPYRESSLPQYGHPSASHAAHRDFRGYDQTPSTSRGEFSDHRSEKSNNAISPRLSNSHEGSTPVAELHATESRPSAGKIPTNRPNEHAIPTRTGTPVASSPPAVEVRPHAMDDIERGSDVKNHSSRGRDSYQGAVRNQNSVPEPRPSGIINADGKRHPR